LNKWFSIDKIFSFVCTRFLFPIRSGTSGLRQNRRQKVFNRGALRFFRGAWTFVQGA